MRAQDLLPDHIDSVTNDGISIRKGTVGAFLINARTWLSNAVDDEAKVKAETDIVGALPALQVLGLFDLMTVNDSRLRALISTHLNQ